jgi:hypothetical protein
MVEIPIRIKFARRIPDPVVAGAERHILLCAVEDVPADVPKDPNPREQRIDRGIWREIRQHLLNETGAPNTFHLKNKGITVLASEVRRQDEENYILVVRDGEGIVDGGHTYTLVVDTQDEVRQRNSGAPPDARITQFVKFEVLTGLDRSVVTEIAGGLNTAIQVQTMSLLNLEGAFNWMKEIVAAEPYAETIAFKENENTEYDARDLVVLLDLFNISAFPNSGSEHPWRAYMSKAAVLDAYETDAEPFKRLAPILKEILVLHDIISIDSRTRHNEAGGKAGNLSFIEKRQRGEYLFPFTGKKSPTRLARAALFPMMAAFRWMLDDKSGQPLAWRGGFANVLKVWERAAAELMKATQNVNVEVGYKANAIGRSRNHWSNLHNIVAKHDMMSAR